MATSIFNDKNEKPNDQMLKNARKYMEGRGISIEVRTIEDVEIVKKLVEIKINN